MAEVFVPGGPYAAMITPYAEDGSVHEGNLRKLVDFLSGSGISGLFPCGSTGEFVHMSVEENCRVMEIVVSQCGGRMDVLPGCGSTCLENTLKMLRKAEELGCPAAVVCPPYYYTLGDRDMVAYYRKLAAQASHTKIILYNIPFFTSEISMEAFCQLLQEPNIIAVKDSSANMTRLMHYLSLVRQHRPDFRVLTGTDDILVPALMGGIAGSMTAFSCIVPELNVAIYSAMARGDYEEALKVQHITLRLLRLAGSFAFPVGYRLLLARRGFPVGPEKQTFWQEGSEAYARAAVEMDSILFEALADRARIPV